MRLATANAASGRDGRTGHGGPPDLEDWARQAAELGIDVLAVQEVDHLLSRSSGVDQTAAVARVLAAGGPAWHSHFAAAVHGTPGNIKTMRSAPRTDPTEPSYGIALLSRHPVESWDELRMAPSSIRVPVPAPSWTDERLVVVPDEQRVAIAARVLAPTGSVTVVTTHLSFVPWRAAAQLRELVAWARDLPRPLLLLGDLNLPGRLPATISGWTPVLAGPTYPAARPVAQLDHVLLDPGSTHLCAQPGSTHRLAGSDHLALRVEVSPCDATRSCARSRPLTS